MTSVCDFPLSSLTEGPPPPSPLTELTVLEITSTSFTISLRPLHRDVENGNTIHCLINVTNMDRRNVVLHDNVNCASPEFRVPELSADCVYQVAVTAVLGERVGPSMTLFVKTSPYVEGVYIHKHIYPICTYKINPLGNFLKRLHFTAEDKPHQYAMELFR